MKNAKLLVGAFALSLLFCAACQKSYDDPLPTVSELDLEQYAGKWYEIARLPVFFEKDLVNVTATYTIKENGKIELLNEGYKNTPDGKHKTAKGTASRPNEAEPGKLKVRFFLFGADYLVTYLDENYEHAIVSNHPRSVCWILSRKPQMADSTYQRLAGIAAEKGVDTSQFYQTPQEWAE